MNISKTKSIRRGLVRRKIIFSAVGALLLGTQMGCSQASSRLFGTASSKHDENKNIIKKTTTRQIASPISPTINGKAASSQLGLNLGKKNVGDVIDPIGSGAPIVEYDVPRNNKPISTDGVSNNTSIRRKNVSDIKDPIGSGAPIVEYDIPKSYKSISSGGISNNTSIEGKNVSDVPDPIGSGTPSNDSIYDFPTNNKAISQENTPCPTIIDNIKEECDRLLSLIENQLASYEVNDTNSSEGKTEVNEDSENQAAQGTFYVRQDQLQSKSSLSSTDKYLGDQGVQSNPENVVNEIQSLFANNRKNGLRPSTRRYQNSSKGSTQKSSELEEHLASFFKKNKKSGINGIDK